MIYNSIMTTKQGYPIIGSWGYICHPNGLQIKVEVIDLKQSYGRTRYQVKPLEGKGTAWVEVITIEE